MCSKNRGVAFKFRMRVAKYSLLEKHHQIRHWLSGGELCVRWNVQWGALPPCLDTELRDAGEGQEPACRPRIAL